VTEETVRGLKVCRVCARPGIPMRFLVRVQDFGSGFADQGGEPRGGVRPSAGGHRGRDALYCNDPGADASRRAPLTARMRMQFWRCLMRLRRSMTVFFPLGSVRISAISSETTLRCS